MYATFSTQRIFRTGELITGRIIKDAVIPIRLFGWVRTQFECLWDFNSPLATRDLLKPFNGVRRFLIFPFGNRLSDCFVGMIEA